MQTILITGASSGIGRATAELLVNDGHRLILIARRREKLEEFKSKFAEGRIYTASVDVTKPSDVEMFFASLPEEFREIDVLVNNAGLALGMEPAQRADLDQWRQMVKTNVIGMLNVTHPTLRIMERRGGHVINISSTAAQVPYKGGNVYGATKAFVDQFSNNLRVDLHGLNVRVTVIAPGMVGETEFSEVRFGDEEKAKALYEGKRYLTPADVGHAIKYAIDQPPHVNIGRMVLMPTDQSFGGQEMYQRKS